MMVVACWSGYEIGIIIFKDQTRALLRTGILCALKVVELEMWAAMPRSSVYPALSHVQNNHEVLLLVTTSEFIIDSSTIVTTKLMLLIPLRSVFFLGDDKTDRRPSFGDEVGSRLDNCCDHSFN